MKLQKTFLLSLSLFHPRNKKETRSEKKRNKFLFLFFHSPKKETEAKSFRISRALCRSLSLSLSLLKNVRKTYRKGQEIS